MELKPELQQKHTFSQNMIQSVQFLQMGLQELETHVEEMAMENPLIELEELDSGKVPDESASVDLARRTEWLIATDLQNRLYYEMDSETENTYEPQRASLGESLEKHLMAQLAHRSQTEYQKQIFSYLVQSLDSRGYLDKDLGDIAVRFHLSPQECESYLEQLQSCEPPGIGARDLKECLLLQLKRIPDRMELTEILINDYLELVGKRRFSQIAAQLGCSPSRVQRAAEQLQKLNPIPGNGFSPQEGPQYIYPDILVVNSQGHFEIQLNEPQTHRIRINNYYVDMLKQTHIDQETKKYIQSKLEQVLWAVQCVEQRNVTLRRVAVTIVERQHTFLRKGQDIYSQ